MIHGDHSVLHAVEQDFELGTAALKLGKISFQRSCRAVQGSRYLRDLISGTLVYTGDTAITGVDGGFKLPFTSAGKYVILASDSVLAPLGISRTVPVPAQLSAPNAWDVWLTFHPRSAM